MTPIRIQPRHSSTNSEFACRSGRFTLGRRHLSAAKHYVLGWIIPILLAGFILPGCERSKTDSIDIDLEATYASRDTAGMATAMQQDHFRLRRHLDLLLAQLLEATASSDTLAQMSVIPELTWLCQTYHDLSGLTDKTRLLRRRLTWSAEESASRLSLDSTYAALDSRRRSQSISDPDFRHQLLKLRDAYHLLSDSFTVTSIDHALGKSWAEAGVTDSASVFVARSLQQSVLLDNLQQAGYGELLAARIGTLNQADYLASEKALLRATAYFERVGDFRNVAGTRVNRAYNSSLLFQTAEAIKNFRAARQVYARLGDSRREAYCIYAQGVTYFFGDQFDSAALFLDLALQKRQELADKHPDLGNLVLDLAYAEGGVALIAQHDEDYSTAHTRYARAEKLFLQCEAKEGLGTNRLNHASLLRTQKHYDQAREKYRFVLENSAEFESSIHAQFGLAVCDYYQGQDDAAIANLRRCIQRLESSRNRLALPNLTAGMLTDKLAFYHLAAAIFLKRYHADTNPGWLDSAFDYLERSKAKSFVDLLRADESPAGTTEQDRLVARISMVENDLLLRRGDTLAQLSDLAALEDSLHATRIRAGTSSTQASEPPPGLTSARRALHDSKTVILSYMVSEFGSWLFAVGRDDVSVYPIRVEQKELTRQINEYLQIISKPPDRSTNDEIESDLSRKLAEVLLPGEVTSDTAVTRLIIVPAGRLHYLPFEALLDQHDRYLVEKFEVSYAPSVTALKILQDREPAISASRVVAFGDPLFANSSFAPLKYSREEVQVLSDLFGAERVQLRLGNEATEKALTGIKYSNVKYLHLATHGICNDRRPDRSALVLAEDSGAPGDGLLHPGEIAALDLPVELVFLSACRSGTGLSYPGEGVLSLAQPFFVAGASSVVASYWNINDRVAVDFVASFYEGLVSGTTKAAALANAKRTLINSPRELYRQPYFWAPFVLIGE